MSKRRNWLRRPQTRAGIEIRERANLSRKRRRLVVERLAERRVLAAITGEVFEDVNFSLRREGAESALESRVLYLDANQNASLDDGEVVALSNASGQFTFPNLSDGTYLVRLFNGTSTQQQTFPIQAENQGPGFSVANGTDAIFLGPATAVVAGGNVQVGDTATGQSDAVSVADQLADVVAMPDGTLLAIGVDNDTQGAWLVDPTNQTVRATGFVQGNAPAANGGAVWSQIEIDQSGLGFALGQDGNSGVLRSIDASDTATGLQVTATTTVPVDTQLLSSSVGPRSILAWAGNGGLEVSLWSNGGSQIGNNTVTLPGASELLDFDDAQGLLAVRNGDGKIRVHDVDGNFAALHTFSDIGNNVLLDGSRDLLMALSSADETLRLIDLRDGSTLINLDVDLSSVGSVTTMVHGGPGNSIIVLGSSGVANVSLLKPGAHRVEVGGDQTTPIRFGVNVQGNNSAPGYDLSPSFTMSEDSTLNVPAPGVLSSASDADGDSFIVLQTGPAGHGTAATTLTGGLRYQPEQDFNGEAAVPIILHDGRDASAGESIRIIVQPVPDPPTVQSPAQPLPEDAQPGDIVGPIVINDPDGIINDHTVVIDDGRFEVIDDQIIFVGGGIDYETESETLVTIQILDEEYSEESVEQVITVTIGDVNEPIIDLFDIYDNTEVGENVPGSYVTTFDVEDPDANEQHTYSIDDDRFVFRGADLYLVDGVALDHERTPEVLVNITATDLGGHSLTYEFAVRVLDEIEQPQIIELGGDSVVEFVPGDVVGDVIVDGVPVGDGYTATVDDSRFEIVDSTLKLVDGQTVELAVQSEIELTITVGDLDGQYEAVSESFVINVLANSTPFHNDSLPYDVNRNGQVTAADALALINYLNAFGPGSVGSGNPAFGYDVNSDQFVTALDALLVLNYLNLPGNAGTVNGEGGEGESGGSGGEGEQTPEGDSPQIDRRIQAIANQEDDVETDPSPGIQPQRPRTIGTDGKAVLPQFHVASTDGNADGNADAASDELTTYQRTVDDALRLMTDRNA